MGAESMDCVEYSGFAYGFLFMMEDLFGGRTGLRGTFEDGGFVVVGMRMGAEIPGWRLRVLCDVERMCFGLLGRRSPFREFAGEFFIFLGTRVVVIDGNV